MPETSHAGRAAFGHGERRPKRPPLRIALFVLLGSAAACALSCRGNPRRAVEREEGLAIDPDPIDLGKLGLGLRGEAAALVVNRGAAPVAIDRFEVSCPCIEVSPITATIGPASSQALRVAFDPGGDLDFRGRLAVPLRGYSGSRVVATATVLVEVADTPNQVQQ